MRDDIFAPTVGEVDPKKVEVDVGEVPKMGERGAERLRLVRGRV